MNNESIVTRGPDINLQAGCLRPMSTPPWIVPRRINKYWPMIGVERHRGRDYGMDLLSGPISHVWFGVLERLMATRHYYGGLALRMLLDASLFSPMAVAGCFSRRGLLEGKSIAELQEKLAAKWQQAVVASWSFWPAVNNYSFQRQRMG